jgi:hypothetical protein
MRNAIYRDHKVGGYVSANGAKAVRTYRNYAFVGWQIVASDGAKLALVSPFDGVDVAQDVLSKTA